MEFPILSHERNQTEKTAHPGVMIASTVERVRIPLVFCFFVYSFLVLLFCTKNSPLFPVNDWQDANIYYTMGKGMMNGYTPYVDLIDNKGPLLYLLYGLSWLIDPRGFSGVYIVQSLLMGISVLYVYKLARLFVRSELCAFFTALLSPALMLTARLYADAFNYGGGGPDEFCRAVMIAALYYFVLFFQKRERDVNGYRLWHTALLGFLAGCVFLMKFNYITFWLGFLIAAAVCFISQKNYATLWKHIGLFLAGFSVCVAPYLVYALMTDSLQAFLREYLFYNATYSVSVTPAVDSAIPMVKALFGFGGFVFFIVCSPLPSITLITGSVFVFRRADKRFKLGYILSFIGVFISTYIARVFPSSSIPITVFCLMGLIAMARLAEKAKIRLKRTVLTALAVIAIFVYTVSDNNLVEFMILERTDEVPDFRESIAETVEDDKTLLELMSLDSGIYTACGVIPGTPYFYKPNIDHAIYPDALEAQYEIIANKKTDYAVVSLVNDELLGAYSEQEMQYKKKMLTTLRENYDFVEKYSATGFQAYRQYHLYRVKPEQ